MSFPRTLKIVAFCLFGAFVFLNLVAITNGILADAFVRIMTGWALFLNRNLRSLALEPDILFSGLIASVLSILTLHFLARWISTHYRFRWPIRSTLSVFGFVVVLFAASFLVPGILSVSQGLISEPWVSRSHSSEGFIYRQQLSSLYSALIDRDLLDQNQPVPHDMDSLVYDAPLLSSGSYRSGFTDSGFLNPAAGLRFPDHERLPLFISPEYLKLGKPVRQVIFSDSRIEVIDPDQFEALLKQAAEIHRKARDQR